MPDVLDTAPSQEPVTLAEAQAHLNITSADDNSYITALIAAARQYAENHLQRALITQTRSLYLDAFASEMMPAFSPLQSVLSITYNDENGATQTLSTSVYNVDAVSTPGKVTLGYNQSWPSTRTMKNAVRIQYKAGYGDSGSAVPEAIRQAMLLLVGHWYENREPVAVGMATNNIDFTVTALLQQYRVMRA